ncbi:unnamed protein product [Urochloa decumbens]|uniref:Uncharacterized protein n=1 Tax=Urochloa decumbens TaxID=240449 RepID=A0ABC9FLN0_9POAL
MGEMVASALAQEGVSRVSSYISTKLDDKASRAHNIARLEMALSRLEFVLERTGKMPITYVSLLRRRKMFVRAYIEGTDLLNKHKLGVLEGHQETGQVVVQSSPYSYLQRFARCAANFSISSLVGLNKEHLSSSVVQMFEWHAACADKFVADVESCCSLRCDSFFHYPFVRQLFEGKTFGYQRMKGSQRLCFHLFPVISKGRGIEARLWFNFFAPERLDESLNLELMLRLSESTDIVGIAISCLRSSASLLNLVALEDAVGELILLSNLQDISYSYDPPSLTSQGWYGFLAGVWRSYVVIQVCTSQVLRTSSHQSYHTYSQTSFPRASDKAGRIRNAMMIDQTPPLELTLFFTPHSSRGFRKGECFITKAMLGNNEDTSPYGSIQQTIDRARSEAMECLLRHPEVTNCRMSWNPNHGSASFCLERPRGDIIAAVASTRERYNTRRVVFRGTFWNRS